MRNIFLILIIFLSLYYGLVYILFIEKTQPSEFPALRARLGTILWHSSDQNGKFQGNKTTNFHTYCYYPTSEAQYPNKAGEYLLKRVKGYQECTNWLGVVEFREDTWVSEREKIWWNPHQFEDASLADTPAQEKTI